MAVRIMPHSDEAEVAVIGAMMIDPATADVVTQVVKEDDFYQTRNKLMFRCITNLADRAENIDTVTVKTEMERIGVPDEMLDTNFITSYVDKTPTSVGVKDYAQVVADKALLRRMIQTMSNLTNDCYAENKLIKDIKTETEDAIFALLNADVRREYVPLNGIVMDALNEISARSMLENSLTGVPSGYDTLDRITGGFQPSDLVLIAARPSMGKTSFALNCAAHMAIRAQKRVAVFSLEMSRIQIVNRFFGFEGLIDSTAIRSGKLSDKEWEQLTFAADRIIKAPIIIDDTPAITISELRSKCRKLKLDGGLDCIVIDYLQLMRSAERQKENKVQEVTEISKGLKAVAKELDVPVIALSQLSRAAEVRDDHVPRLSDLRESGAIEQDADIVMFLYRDDYYHGDESEKKGIVDIMISKHRNGPLGQVELAWLPQYTKFAELEKFKTS